MDGKQALIRSALLIASATALSRVLGLVRETVIAYEFGASAEYDAFLIAFLLPHMLRMLLAEGALSTAFVPLFTEYASRSGRALAQRFASNVFTVALLAFPVIVVLGIWLAPYYVPFLADGFDEAKRTLTVQLTAITFPFLMLVGLAAIVMGVLHSHGKFFAPAFAPVLFNVGLITGALVLARLVDPPIYGLAYGVLLGGLAQWLFQIPFLRGRFRYRPTLDLGDEGLRRLLILMLPTVLGLLVVELNLLVDNKLASRLGDGNIASLQYAIRLFQLPLGLFAVALATALLPQLSRLAARSQDDAFLESLQHGLRLAAFVLLPAAVGLLVLGGPVIALLFEHGRFTAADTARTLYVLRFLSLGLLGYGATHLLTRAFYALRDTRTPVAISAVAVGVNIALDYALIGPLGVGGLALATALAGLIQMALLAWMLQRRLGAALLAPLAGPVGKMALSALLMGAVIYVIDGSLAGLSAGVFLRVGIAVTAGALSYGALALWGRLLPSIAPPPAG
jgi:putative peptidoglycan lipid II flippase